MKNINDMLLNIGSGKYDHQLASLYGSGNIPAQRRRLIKALNEFENQFGFDRDVRIFSVPGRTELGGNHTDHQYGHVLTAAVNMDIIGIVSPNNDGIIRVKSEGFPMNEVAVAATFNQKPDEYSPLGDMIITDLDPYPDEEGKSIALIRGIAARFYLKGIHLTGFDCYTTSDIMSGSGMSSSAAFEVLIGNIMNSLYTNNRTPAAEIAEICQFSENFYFGKPCGIMGQLTAAVGGIISMDLYDRDNPMISKIDYDFSTSGYTLCIVECGASHANLISEYSSIPDEMKNVANFFGKTFLSRLSSEEFYKYIPEVRIKCGDRAVLRAIHFFEEDKRAVREAEYLQKNNFQEFLKEVNNSGRSSCMYLQNIYVPNDVYNQPLSIALAKCELLLREEGAFRVHGGGFAGTIQAFVPNSRLDYFRQEMESVFGTGTCHILEVRSVGGTEIGD
ncbi:MAG: galactokinase [Porcipelethomonas sp.]